ncbi:CDP-glycerol glycerophosphotransferase family protein [Arthrobacter sp. UYCu723]
MSPAQDTIDYGLLLEERQEWTAAVEVYTELLDGPQGADAELAFRLGHAHFHLRQFEESAEHLQEATALKPGMASWHYRLGFVQEQLGSLKDALENYTVAISLEPHRERWQLRLQAARDLHAKAGRGSVPGGAPSTDPGHYSTKLEQLRAAKGQLWQELDVLEAGAQAHSGDAEWLAQLGAAQYGMKLFAEAANSFTAASAIDDANSEWHFLAGHSYEIIGRLDQAQQSYEKAIQHDALLKADIYGVGAFFQKKGLWVEALEHYKQLALLHPSRAELAYRVGLASDRCYRWEEAEYAYGTAITLGPDVPYWHYKLGLARERQLDWVGAAAAYAHAAAFDAAKPYWSYKAGYALEAAGRPQQAAAHYMASGTLPASLQAGLHAQEDSLGAGSYWRQVLSLGIDALVPLHSGDAMGRAGELAIRIGDWEAARSALTEATARSADFNSQRFFLLGVAHFKLEDYPAACQAFRQTRLFKTSDGIDVEQYLKNKTQKLSMEYVEHYENLDLRDDIILWESNHGASIGCHPLAIFDQVQQDPDYAHFSHYWVINNDSNIPDRLRGLENVFFVQTHSDLYKRVLASARYLVNNVSFPPYFIRKDRQHYLNTWHGTPLKTLGRDMAGGPVAHANIARNFLQASHIMSPNTHTSQAIVQRHDIEGIFRGKIAVTGSPRIDGLVTPSPSRREELRRRLGIDPDDSRPVVLYAPTWRGASDDRYVDASRLQQDLEGMQGADHHLFFRAHRLTEGLLSDFDAGQALVPGDIDTNDLLIAVDLLITDYSSIFFDFLPTGRPIVFYAYDLADYSAERGLYFDMNDMPGRLVTERSLLPTEISSSLQEPQFGHPRHLSALADYCPSEDGRSAERVVRFFFEDDPDGLAEAITDDKTTLLFHHGLLPNGIATSFHNLVSSLDTQKFRVVLIVEPHVLAANEGRLEKLRDLPKHVQIIGRVGVQSHTPEERWINRKFTAQFNLASDAQWSIYRSSYRREFKRIFGVASFDSLIEFDGYAPFWTGLIANGSPSGHKSIYMHNDMADENKMKFPVLETVFRQYHDFDSLISVADSVSKRNREQIAHKYGLNPDRFVHSDNQINPQNVLQAAEEDVDPDIAEWYSSSPRNYVAIGRLSPEKDHAKLIRAFARFHGDSPTSKLLILGDGPLREDLERLIADLGATDFIWLAGQRSNPYPALKHAHCFVLSSLHEGQPMVLFEAMILGLPIVCTDMPGPRDVLQDRYGMIVENSEEGLITGFAAAELGQVPNEYFDTLKYVASARSQFLNHNLANTFQPSI